MKIDFISEQQPGESVCVCLRVTALLMLLLVCRSVCFGLRVESEAFQLSLFDH